MPLSISKLQDLLESKGFVPTKYFIMDGAVFYIELFSVKTADIFLLYIPSKYNFEPSKAHKDITYKISFIDMDTQENLSDEYAGAPDNLDVQNTYNSHHVDLSPDHNKMEEHLTDKYKQDISLNDISKEDISSLKAIFRQMKRLRYCVQNLKYKLGVIFKNYICAIRRDDDVNCFTIKHYVRSDVKKLFVIIDLETFYEKSEKILDDIHTVSSSVYHILEKNQTMHKKMISRIAENKKEIQGIPLLVQEKKVKYDGMISKLESMMGTMSLAEAGIIAQLDEISKSQPTGLQSDITRAHNKSRLEDELNKVNQIKGKITSALVTLRNKRENAILNVDDLMFDSTVMFDGMVRNFSKLKEFC